MSSTQQNKNSGSKQPSVKPVEGKVEKDFASEITGESQETLNKLITDGRHLAETFFDAKREELENYARQALEQVQSDLVNSIDTSLEKLTTTFESQMGRARESVTGFVDETGKSIQRVLKSIDERPAIPVLIAFVGGAMLGVFLSSRGQLRSIQNPKAKSNHQKSVA